MVGDFSNEKGLPGRSSDFFKSGKDGMSRVVPLLGTVISKFSSPSPETGAQVPLSVVRSLGHGEAEPFTTLKDPSLSAPSWVYRVSVGLVGLTGEGERWVTGSGHCNAVDSTGSSFWHPGSPIGDGTRRTVPVALLVATPGRVKRERRRVKENL